MYLRPAHQLSYWPDIDSRGLQEFLSNAPLQTRRGVSKPVLLEQDLPRKAEPVRMNPRTRNTNQTVAIHNSITQNQLLLLADSGRKPDKVKPPILSKQFRDDRCLSPDNR